MLLARLLGWIKGHRTAHIFLLEVLAVFIGITASLFIDDWRQREQDREILDHLFQETHYNALQDVAAFRIYLGVSKASLEDAQQLLYGDTSAWSDETLVRRYGRALWLTGTIDLQPGYRRLINTSLSIPFDHTMAELDFHFRQIVIQSEAHNDIHAQILVLRRQLLRAAGLADAFVSFFAPPILGQRGGQLAQLWDWLFSNEVIQANASGARRVRAALETREVRDLLLELIGMRAQHHSAMIYLASRNDDVIASIRRYDPDVTLPVGFIELLGDATTGEWTNGLRMTPDRHDPNIWRIRAELTDGEVKFRADNNWSSNWGAPFTPETRDVFLNQFEGDPGQVFPTGTAQFFGRNIPVEAGTYDVSFNSQSFEYSFERIP